METSNSLLDRGPEGHAALDMGTGGAEPNKTKISKIVLTPTSHQESQDNVAITGAEAHRTERMETQLR